MRSRATAVTPYSPTGAGDSVSTALRPQPERAVDVAGRERDDPGCRITFRHVRRHESSSHRPVSEGLCRVPNFKPTSRPRSPRPGGAPPRADSGGRIPRSRCRALRAIVGHCRRRICWRRRRGGPCPAASAARRASMQSVGPICAGPEEYQRTPQARNELHETSRGGSTDRPTRFGLNYVRESLAC